jgi:pimeloyl-ACP methyl ester carboxylesterase
MPIMTRRSSARTPSSCANIPAAGLLIQPEVSHFSFLQNPVQFNNDVLHFLEHVPWQ